MPWLDTHRSPIGLDVGHRRVKAVQLRKVGAGWRIEAAAILPRRHPNEPLGAEEAAWLHEVLDRQGFIGSRLVTTAPAQGVVTNVLELPPRTSNAPLEQIARMEMARLQRCEPDKFELAVWDLPAPARGGGVSHVMAAACTHEAADLLLDDLQSAGWQVLAFDVPSWALARALSLWSTGAAMTPVLDIGAQQSEFILLHEGVVAYERRLPDLGLEPLFQGLSREHDLDDEGVEHWLTAIGLQPAEPAKLPGAAASLEKNRLVSGLISRLAHELQVSLSFVMHRYPEAAIKRLALIGGGAAIPGLAPRLGPQSIEASLVRLEDLVPCASGVGEARTSPAALIALGLAMYAPS